jgi:hypothetical protein
VKRSRRLLGLLAAMAAAASAAELAPLPPERLGEAIARQALLTEWLPQGLADGNGVIERFSNVLQRRLPADPHQRGTIVAALESHARLLAEDDVAGALDALPATSAIARVAAAAHRAWDRDDLPRFRFLAERLVTGGWVDGAAPAWGTRLALASTPAPTAVRQVQHLTPLDTAPPLQRPPSLARREGSTVTVHDVVGRALYRLAVGPRAVLHDDGRLAVLLDDHSAWLLGPTVPRLLPAGAAAERCLGVAGGWSWWHVGEGRVSALDTSGAGRLLVQLPETPLAAPLPWNGGWCFLSSRFLLVVSADGAGVQVLRHRLDAAPGWCLHDPDKPLLLSDDGRAWALAMLTENARRAQRWQALADADTPAPVLSEALASPAADDDERRALAQALLATPATSAAVALVPQLNPAQRLQVLLRRHLLVGDGVWATALERDAAAAATAPLAAHPDDDPRDDPHGDGRRWRHLRTPTGALRSLRGERSETEQPARNDRSTGALRWWWAGCALTVRAAQRPGFGNETVVTARDASGTQLWQRRWSSPGYLPGRHLAVADGHLVVSEGLSRLHILDPDDGRLVAVHLVADSLAMPERVRVLDDGAVAISHPIGIDNRLRWLPGGEDQRLPSPARWLLAANRLRAAAAPRLDPAVRLIIGHADGVVRGWPAGTPLSDWPSPAASAPVDTPAGLR